MSIRIGILGYGNLGRGVECAIKHNPDLELVAVFTRRAPETVKILAFNRTGITWFRFRIASPSLLFSLSSYCQAPDPTVSQLPYSRSPRLRNNLHTSMRS